MTGFPAFAVYTPVANRSTGIRRPTLGLIMHSQEGNNSPRPWFDNPASEGSSTWWIAKAGRLECYVDPDTEQAWCQRAGNFDYHSVEFEGWTSEPLTSAQISTAALLYRAGRERYRWPLTLAEAPGQPGFGWHGMGGAAWGHPLCPGPIRAAQRQQILYRAAVLTDPVGSTAPPPPGPPVKFPLPAGHWFGIDDGTPASHSGLAIADQLAIRRIQTVVFESIDGAFGAKTQAGVRRFQSRHVLGVDGRVGPLTWAIIGR